MSLPSAAALFLLILGSQDPGAGVQVQVERLASEDIAERERGLEALKVLDPRVLPQLRTLAEAATDAETRARLTAAIRHLTLREADRSLAEGDFSRALNLAALADGASDPDAYVAATKAQVAIEVRDRFPTCPMMDDCPTDLETVAGDIVDAYGPWGVAVLLDALAQEEADLPAARLLARLPDVVVPALRQALASSNPVLRREACYVVNAMAFEEENLPEDGVVFAAALQIALDDPSTDRGTRMRIALILERIRKNVSTRLYSPFRPASEPPPRRQVRFLRARPASDP
jgi:hypothetical protein